MKPLSHLRSVVSKHQLELQNLHVGRSSTGSSFVDLWAYSYMLRSKITSARFQPCVQRGLLPFHMQHEPPGKLTYVATLSAHGIVVQYRAFVYSSTSIYRPRMWKPALPLKACQGPLRPLSLLTRMTHAILYN